MRRLSVRVNPLKSLCYPNDCRYCKCYGTEHCEHTATEVGCYGFAPNVKALKEAINKKIDYRFDTYSKYCQGGI